MAFVGGALVLTFFGILLFGTAQMIGRMGLIIFGILLLVGAFFGLDAHLHTIHEAEDAAKKVAETAQWDATCTKIKEQYGSQQVDTDSPDWADWMVCKRHVISPVKPPYQRCKYTDGMYVCHVYVEGED